MTKSSTVTVDDVVGKTATEVHQALLRSFVGLGLTESQARIAVAGRRGPNQIDVSRLEPSAKKPADDPEEALVASFRRLGLSESGARIAARGRRR